MIWKEVAALLGRLLGSVYLVGGAVRDLLRGVAPKDLDFATPLSPEEVARRLGEAGLPLDLKGFHHGTVGTVVDGLEVEVTTFRVDLRTDGRRAQVNFTQDIIQDMGRRDFTVNAMALTPEGKLVDPFGGQRDLAEGVLRAVGDPHRRFREDYLRVVRLARFAAALGLEPEARTWQAALEAAPQVLAHVSLPRIGQELTKGLVGGRGRFIRLLLELDLLYPLFPELVGPHGPAHDLRQNPLHHPEGDVLAHLAQVLDRLRPEGVDPDLAAWAAFLHDVGKAAAAEPTGEGWYRFPRHEAVGAGMVRGIARRFGFSNRWAEAVEAAVRLHMRPLQAPTPRAVRRFQAEAGPHLPLLKAVCYADGEGRREDLEAWFALQDTPLTPLLRGADLLELGLPPGPRIGELLRRAAELQLELGLGSRNEIIEALRKEGLL